jgi:hypothetical protein
MLSRKRIAVLGAAASLVIFRLSSAYGQTISPVADSRTWNVFASFTDENGTFTNNAPIPIDNFPDSGSYTGGDPGNWNVTGFILGSDSVADHQQFVSTSEITHNSSTLPLDGPITNGDISCSNSTLVPTDNGFPTTDSGNAHSNSDFLFAFTVSAPFAFTLQESAQTSGGGNYSGRAEVHLDGQGVGTEVIADAASPTGVPASASNTYTGIFYPSSVYTVTAHVDGSEFVLVGSTFGGASDNSEAKWLLAATTGGPTIGTFNPTDGGGGSLSWGSVGIWEGGTVPNGDCQVAYLGQTTAPTTLTLDDPVTLSTLTIDSTNAYTINGPSTLTIECPADGGHFNVFHGDHTINAQTSLLSDTTADIEAGSLTLTNLQPTTVNVTKTGAGALVVNSMQANTLTVNAGTVKIITQSTPRNDSATVSVVGGLTIAGNTDAWTGTLDLNDSDLIVHNGDLATITNQLKSGFNTGFRGSYWNGTGITSSAAANDATFLTTLGVILNTDGTSAFYTAFDGQTVTDADVLVKYTYYGDADLDGKVSGNDYTLIDHGYSADQTNPGSVTGWVNGDFNYDGLIDGSDYSLIDNAFNLQGSNGLADPMNLIAANTSEIASSSPVPEPTGLAMLALAGVGMLRRRRRASRSQRALRGQSLAPRKATMIEFEPLENRQLLSCVIDIRGVGGVKSATAASVGQVIPLQIWAVITGNDASGANDGIDSVTGSFLSTMTSDASVQGNLAAAPLAPFQANGTQFGRQQDLNGDGNIDVGSNDGSKITGFFNARAGGMDTSGTVKGASQEFLLGTLNYTVTSLPTGLETDINFSPRIVSGPGHAAVWLEDGQAEYEKTSTLAAGTPFRLNSTAQPVQLSGSVIGTSGSYQSDGNTIAKAFDSNLGSFFDGPSADGNWAGLDLGNAAAITSINYAPRTSFANRMVGGIFQASNTADFSSGVVNLYTISTAPAQNVFTAVNVTATGTYRYVRYLSPAGSYGNIAELQVLGVSTVPPSVPLTGAIVGTSGSYRGDGYTTPNAFDDNFNTYFDAPDTSGDWVGLDLGNAANVTSVSFSPRSNWASRMVGGVFQASNAADFSSGVVNLYTISTAPAQNVFTTAAVSESGNYRYVRYLSPDGAYCNAAELQFFGVPTVPHVQLTGTIIGTPGSYQNNGDTIDHAFDGNLATFYTGASPDGNWMGLDTGSAHSISQISFAPRSGFSNRMIGGIFQASNTADFSSGTVNLYTVTVAPISGILASVGVSDTGSYRYFRYLAAGGTNGDIAEVRFAT